MKPPRDKELDFRAIIENMTESILITDTSLDPPGPYITYVNAAFERMTGWSKEEIIGKNPRILQGPNTDLSIFQMMRHNLRNKQIWKGRTVNYKKDGSQFTMRWSIAPVADDAGIIYQYLAVQTDVTKEVQIERQLEASRKAEQKRLIEIEQVNKKISNLLVHQKHTLNLFTKYVPESIVNKTLLAKTSDLMDTVELNVALLFCDIRNFATIAESLEPQEVGQLLNVYYSKMSEVIAHYNGEINQFVGDEIFASFGAPLPMNNPSMAATMCAKGMINKLEEINSELRMVTQMEIIVGIGIHYGPVIAGNLGSKDRISYSLTGDAVNTAKRIEALSREVPNAILISETVNERLNPEIETISLGDVQLKGKNRAITVYRVL